MFPAKKTSARLHSQNMCPHKHVWTRPDWPKRAQSVPDRPSRCHLERRMLDQSIVTNPAAPRRTRPGGGGGGGGFNVEICPLGTPRPAATARMWKSRVAARDVEVIFTPSETEIEIKIKTQNAFMEQNSNMEIVVENCHIESRLAIFVNFCFLFGFRLIRCSSERRAVCFSCLNENNFPFFFEQEEKLIYACVRGRQRRVQCSYRCMEIEHI